MTTQERIALIFKDDPSAHDGNFIRVNNVESFCIGCDGKMLIGVREMPITERTDPLTPTEGSIGTMIAWALTDDRGAIDIDISELRKFCGPALFAESGADVWGPVREGRILGLGVNLNRVAKLLIGAEGPVRLVHHEHMNMLSIRGVDFVAMIMKYLVTENEALPCLP